MNFVGADASEAWLNGLNHLLAQPKGALPFAVTEIDDPTIEHTEWFLRYNPGSIIEDAPNYRTIARMLVPSGMLDASTPRAARYHQELNRLQRLRRRGMRFSNWSSTYFERLTNFPGTNENQLEKIIQKLRSWPSRPKAALYAHIESPSTTKLRTRGGPCLQYIQVGFGSDGGLDLTALYRSHDYVEKAFGNFVGLTRCLRFICQEAGKPIGKVRCVSINPHIPNKSKARLLIA